jgi:hypothetical protein
VFSFLLPTGFLAIGVLVNRLKPEWIHPVHSIKTLEILDSNAREFVGKFGTMFVSLSECESELVFAQRFIGWALTGPSLFMRVNEILRMVPMPVVGHFMREFEGFLSYVTILQWAVEKLCSEFRDEFSVVRGFSHGGQVLAARYREMIGETIVWPGFVVASRDIRRIVNDFVQGGEGIGFEIVLKTGSIAAKLGFNGTESGDVLIAAGSFFQVMSVEKLVSDDDTWEVPFVRLNWVGSWSNRIGGSRDNAAL